MGNYLGDTIESVLNNLIPGDKYFIIDGGSTDNSLEVIRKYEKNITGWISERDEGYAEALSKGFCLSQTSFQCWINTGDLLLLGALNKARNILNDTGADMIFGDDAYIDENGLIIQISNGKVDNLANMMMYGGWTPLQDACYWRSELYNKVGGINRKLQYAADYDLFLRMSLNGNCRYVPVIFSAFRRHELQKSKVGAIAYLDERKDCQKEQFKTQRNSLFDYLAKSLYYNSFARIRARVGSTSSRHDDLVGRHIKTITCQGI